MTIRDIDKMSEIEIILDNLFWLGFKLCMAGKLETAPNESLAEAEQAINAYILGEVMELIGEDDTEVRGTTQNSTNPKYCGLKELRLKMSYAKSYATKQMSVGGSDE
jgi:hypothetical protein